MEICKGRDIGRWLFRYFIWWLCAYVAFGETFFCSPVLGVLRWVKRVDRADQREEQQDGRYATNPLGEKFEKIPMGEVYR